MVRNLKQQYWHHWFVSIYNWGRVTHIWVSKLTIIGSNNGLSLGRRRAISLNQCCSIVNCALRNELLGNPNRNSNVFIQDAFVNLVCCETATILPRSRCCDVVIFIFWMKMSTMRMCGMYKRGLKTLMLLPYPWTPPPPPPPTHTHTHTHTHTRTHTYVKEFWLCANDIVSYKIVLPRYTVPPEPRKHPLANTSLGKRHPSTRRGVEIEYNAM